MLREIAKVKGEQVPPDDTQLDLLFEDIRALKGHDATYQKLLEMLRDFTAAE
jgi:hypothetical protein